MKTFTKRWLLAVLSLFLTLTALGCSGTTRKAVQARPIYGTSTAQPGPAVVVAAAGDIACDPKDINYKGGSGTATRCRMRATSDLLLTINPTAVLTLGDDQYPHGRLNDFLQSYDSTWGRLKGITHPTPGNHEYWTANAAGYFAYFGDAAGPPGKGYYSFDLGAWHLIALNSNCRHVGGCGFNSPQEQWLREDLRNNRAKCVLAYWHNARFSSGIHGSNRAYTSFWRDLYEAGADLVLVGHDHDYERFAPLDPEGRLDQQRGIREFVVGTGGKGGFRGFYRFLPVRGHRNPNTEVRNSDTFGVLVLTLRPGSYEWTFKPEAGKTFSDWGTGPCHAYR